MTKNYKLNSMKIANQMLKGGYNQAMETCLAALNKSTCSLLFTPNGEMLEKSAKSEKICNMLLKGDILLPDGIFINKFLKRCGFSVAERTNGIDFAERILHYASNHNLGIFLLGADKGYAKKAACHISKKYHGIKVCGYHDGYFKKSGLENKRIIEKINSSGADILFVCFGFPLQEKWLIKNSKNLKSVKLALALGGSIDIWSGHKKRAPEIFRAFGFEWLYRCLYDKSKFHKVLSMAKFAFSVG